MHRFVDEISIKVKAGNGGAGCISFRHLKFVEKAGPDGGDGGAGGNVFIEASRRILSLNHLRKDKTYAAENGKQGMGNDRSGRKGKDLSIRVPIGCELIDEESGEVVHDFHDEEPFQVANGARGGKGNAFFATSTRQAPRLAQPGEETELKKYRLSLKLIADIGLVGFPNAGKSTLLKALTDAKPKIGNYAFTTLSPNLGVLDLNASTRVLIADIPGILEGASKGVGLGISFLKHIERVRLLVFVLDLSTSEPASELEILNSELEQYNPELLQRPHIITFNKVDLFDDRAFIEEWTNSFRKQGIEPILISAVKKEGLEDLKKAIIKQL